MKNKKRMIQIIVTIILLLPLIIFESKIPDPALLISYLIVYFIISYNILKEGFENIFKGDFFDENFLMIIATVGAFFLKEYHEGIMVMLLFQIGELLQSIAIQKSKRSIKHVLDLQPNTALVKINGQIEEKKVSDIPKGSILVVRTGDRIALDGLVLSQSIEVDESALTGESLPKVYQKGEQVMSGAINLSGSCEVETTVVSSESTTTKMIELVKKAQENRSQSETFIRKFSKKYTPTVVFIALALAIVPLFFYGLASWHTWLYRALIFLVISCPCALVISVPLSFFAGIGAGSRHGILFKGSEYIESLTKVRYAVFDKTGTLTTGKFKVVDIVPEVGTKEELLKLAATAEQLSTHPIALSIKEAYGKKVTVYGEIEQLAGYGMKAVVNQQAVYVGNEKLMTMKKILVPKVNRYGTVVYVAIEDQYIGYLLIADTLKDGSQSLSQWLHHHHIVRYMVTGDRKQAAEAINEQLNFDSIKSQCLPKDKVDIVTQLMAKETKKETTLFVGDGLNDAPVIATADIGVAMGGIASQATIEAADIVLMDEDIEKIVTVFTLSNKIMRIVKTNIIFALTIKVAFLILAALGFIGMEWAVFADVGVTILTIMNAMRLLLTKNHNK